MLDPTYRPYSNGDEPSVLSLFEAAFRHSKDPREWEWEFLDYQERSIITVAEVDGKIVGHYAIIPRTMNVKGLDTKVGLVVDVMTHPDTSHRGVFLKSGLTSFRYAEESGLLFIIGFPNEAAIAGHRRVGWVELEKIRLLTRPLRFYDLQRKLEIYFKVPIVLGRIVDKLLTALSGEKEEKRRNNVSWISVEEMIGLGQELEEFIHESLKRFKIANARHLDWLTWRLSEPGCEHHIALVRSLDGRILGLVILRIKTSGDIGVGDILDLLVREGDSRTTKMLLRAAIGRSCREGCVRCNLLRNPARRRTIPSLGTLMIPVPGRIRFAFRPIGDAKLPGFFNDLDNWYIDLIDLD
jgi:hypothetical protein